jgi:hypothetical protein
MDNQALYQVAAGTDLKYGWVVSDCTATLPFICQVPSSIFPCYPPPGSPPPPPRPPSPPSPPMSSKCEQTARTPLLPRRVAPAAPPLPAQRTAEGRMCCLCAAGTPKTNTTFFCEPNSGNCFLLRSGTSNALGFYEAADFCASYISGNLVTYSSRGKQLLVRGAGDFWRARVAAVLLAGGVAWQPHPPGACPCSHCASVHGAHHVALLLSGGRWRSTLGPCFQPSTGTAPAGPAWTPSTRSRTA